ncbi:hypothetical protein BCR39DRAFT_561282 [Naematelia encephala]|uniref:Uncharacterized protein n=1 Tax=Naematelia encephala TaxID=71784 RepID=A0A1Y2AR70_9TREE|nr:hypothetical protein BCR39DRAFT_561282 [Naematelia encephala]
MELYPPPAEGMPGGWPEQRQDSQQVDYDAQSFGEGRDSRFDTFRANSLSADPNMPHSGDTQQHPGQAWSAQPPDVGNQAHLAGQAMPNGEMLLDESGNWVYQDQQHQHQHQQPNWPNDLALQANQHSPAQYDPHSPAYYQNSQLEANPNRPPSQQPYHNHHYHHHTTDQRRSEPYRHSYPRSEHLAAPQVQIFAPHSPPPNYDYYPPPPPPPPPAQGTNMNAGDQMQMLMMNQMMMQQMQAQQVQAAQMAALTQQQGMQGRQQGGGQVGCAKRKGGVTSVNIQNCQQNIKRGPRSKKKLRKVATPPPVVVAVRPTQPHPPALIASANTVMDNWQEATIILVIAMIGLIYLVTTRATNTAGGDKSGEEKKKDAGSARYLVS